MRDQRPRHQPNHAKRFATPLPPAPAQSTASRTRTLRRRPHATTPGLVQSAASIHKTAVKTPLREHVRSAAILRNGVVKTPRRERAAFQATIARTPARARMFYACSIGQRRIHDEQPMHHARNVFDQRQQFTGVMPERSDVCVQHRERLIHDEQSVHHARCLFAVAIYEPK